LHGELQLCTGVSRFTLIACHVKLSGQAQYSSFLVLQIGFFALLIVELVANRGLLDLMGLRIGAGLPFEF